MGFGVFDDGTVDVALTGEGVALGNAKLGEFGLGPDVFFADLAGLAVVIVGGLGEAGVTHEAIATGVEPVAPGAAGPET